MRHDELLAAEQAVLLVTDVQEAFMPHIDDVERVIQRCRVAVAAAQVLELPLIATEQYPRGLGRTVESLRRVLGDVPYYEKLTFDCLGDAAIRRALAATGRKQVLLVGIETHICISQTAYGLLAAGYQPFVAADAVGSRRPDDREVALARMGRAGVILTTTEAAIMEMTVSKEHDRFQQILQIIK